jgi:hypothetical protein
VVSDRLYKRGYLCRKIDADIWVIRSKNDGRHLALLIRRADPKDFALTYAPGLNKFAQNRIRNTVQYVIAEYELPVTLHSSPYIR